VSDEELFARVTDVLMRATPSASAVAIVRASVRDPGSQSHTSAMQILHYDVRDNQSNAHDVSTKLVNATLRRRDSVLHLWENPPSRQATGPRAAAQQAADQQATAQQATGSPSAESVGPDYTVNENVDWAFCVPLRSDACRGWVLYVTGSRAGVITTGG